MLKTLKEYTNKELKEIKKTMKWKWKNINLYNPSIKKEKKLLTYFRVLNSKIL